MNTKRQTFKPSRREQDAPIRAQSRIHLFLMTTTSRATQAVKREVPHKALLSAVDSLRLAAITTCSVLCEKHFHPRRRLQSSESHDWDAASLRRKITEERNGHGLKGKRRKEVEALRMAPWCFRHHESDAVLKQSNCCQLNTGCTAALATFQCHNEEKIKRQQKMKSRNNNNFITIQ